MEATANANAERPAERRAHGKSRRDATPRDGHAAWTAPAGRADPLAIHLLTNLAQR